MKINWITDGKPVSHSPDSEALLIRDAVLSELKVDLLLNSAIDFGQQVIGQMLDGWRSVKTSLDGPLWPNHYIGASHHDGHQAQSLKVAKGTLILLMSGYQPPLVSTKHLRMFFSVLSKCQGGDSNRLFWNGTLR